MTLKLTLFSQEKEDFVLEILIDNDANFSELHQLILNDCNYDEHRKQCFLICDEDWRVKQRICLYDSEDLGYDEDVNLMSRTRIGDFLEDEGQRLAYVFDPEGKRFFLMELTENVFGRTEKKAFVNRRHGYAPLQSSNSSPKTSQKRGYREASYSEREPDEEPEENDIEENFYGDDGFETEELDLEGYEIDE
ncbi:MAG: hypothetical protein K6G92_02310 [Bacteroidaceae bacterium]|nr:hypothetical protein [Bacteroidaceae bacterium]